MGNISSVNLVSNNHVYTMMFDTGWERLTYHYNNGDPFFTNSAGCNETCDILAVANMLRHGRLMLINEIVTTKFTSSILDCEVITS